MPDGVCGGVDLSRVGVWWRDGVLGYADLGCAGQESYDCVRGNVDLVAQCLCGGVQCSRWFVNSDFLEQK